MVKPSTTFVETAPHKQLPTQTFSGGQIDFVGNGLQRRFTAFPQVLTLGEILSQQAVGVCMAAPLPWSAGLREIKRYLQICAHLCMRSNFPALVRDDGAQGHMAQRAQHACVDGLCVFLGSQAVSQ